MGSRAPVATEPARGDPHGGAWGDRRVLVLVGGLPGAGKTRLLDRLLGTAPAGTRGLDSEQVAARLHDLGVRLPYRLLRPAVHALHRARVRRVLGGPQPVVVLTDPLTGRRRRASVLRSARRAGREVRLLLLDVDPVEARRGQVDRRRQLGPRAMARHVRRWRTALEQTRATGRLDGVPAVVVTREETGSLGLEQLLRD
jgi:AAA domain